ncbi:hypothetical protein FHT44_005094 [Mycolicibacterium sp. BK634]|uniref:DUF3560 domain-containing protein n=1 Tax=Mycolicibacterium sp. BK634 TaxID=2587099 RepID=UPI0016222C1A|nr:DUF3560 domain-containing protein [Mycolicibacterium sp. BK634]MBB3752582.1 hypothetical protein [Mycolicibacterium sp. BK634]
MSAVEITHTAEDGTLVDGTSRGDGSNVILKAHGFRWFRTLGMWGIPNSRDRQPNMYKINRAAEALRADGFNVVVSVDASHRDVAEAEADRAQRADDRADALAAKADRRADQATAAWDRHDRACEALPPGGEPIKIGHHSERRHRNAIDKAWNALGSACEASTAAEEAARRADVASRATAHRNNPVTVKNRIDRMEAEQRKDQREIDGRPKRLIGTFNGQPVYDYEAPASGSRRETLESRMAQRADEITYWKGVFAELQAAGLASTYSKETVKKGDQVKYRGSWYNVVRANAKTVSVHFFGGSQNWSNLIGYHEISGHRSAAEAATVSLD